MFHKNTLIPGDGYCSVKSNGFCSRSTKRGKGITPVRIEKCKDAVITRAGTKRGGWEFWEFHWASGQSTAPNPLLPRGSRGQKSCSGLQPSLLLGCPAGKGGSSLLPAAWGTGQTGGSRNNLVGFKKTKQNKTAPCCSLPFQKRTWMGVV